MLTNRVFRWVGWAGIEALGRLLLLLGSTAIFSRVLEAQDFGTVAIVVVATTLAAIFAGTPFEEALTQQRDLKREHVETALATSYAIAFVLFLLSFLTGSLVAWLYEVPIVAQLMPVAAFSIFFSAHSDILRGLARRQRRFTEIAVASLIGHGAGIALALAMLFGGLGLWALLAQRVMVVICNTIALSAVYGALVMPRFSLPHLMELRRYARLQLADRLVDNLNYFALNYIVAGLYGLATLGHVNMALRIVEPIRGAVLGTTHNVAFYYFAALGADAGRKASEGWNVLWRCALISAPVFLGLAAVTPTLLPVLVGPGWEPAIGIAIWISIGTAFFLPTRVVYTSLSARGRPEFGVLSNVVGAVVTIGVLVLAVGLGPIATGVARALGDFGQAALALMLPRRIAGWPSSERLAAFLPGWLLASAMAILVAGFIGLVGDGYALVTLVLSVALGVACYAAALHIFAKGFLEEILGGGIAGGRQQ